MKRAVVVILLFTYIQVLPGQGQSSPANRDESHAQGTKKPSPEPPSSNTVIVVKQEATNTQDDRAKSESKGYFARLLAPENLPNTVLCVVGIGGIIIAICTLRAIRQQTDIADRALRLTEVADVHIQGFIFSVPQNNVALTNPQQPLQPDTRITMVVKNFGRTRAERFTHGLIMGIQE